MKKREQYAIAKMAMRNREHIVAIRPSGNELMLHTLFFAGEIQCADVKPGPEKFSEKEMQLAAQLIDSLTAKFQPDKFHDEYNENVEKLIEQKQKGERCGRSNMSSPARLSTYFRPYRRVSPPARPTKNGIARQNPQADRGVIISSRLRTSLQCLNHPRQR